MWTPWGHANYVEHYDNGIVEVGTASHGGFHCPPELNAQIHEALRNDDGWYEEALEAHFVVVSFPDCFSSDEVDNAAKVIRDWFPERYEAWSGMPATPENSWVVAVRQFRDRHATDYVSILAWGSHHPKVPEGMVGVAATPGGVRGEADPVHFLVPEDEYASRSQFGFVVDPERHERIEPLA